MTLNGPLSIFLRDPLTGELTDVPAPGVHYNTDLATYQANEVALSPYRVTPTVFQNVWAGDDPEAPQWTVALRFPDGAAVLAVLDALA